MSKFNIGDKVRYIGEEHTVFPIFYPAIGTIGVVDRIDSDGYCWVQWPKGATSYSDCWCCADSEIELTTENEKLSNEEIWEMLMPKLVKNGLDWIHYGYDADGNKFYYFDETALKNAVVIAYKSGYYRSQKGRPFKFGEKKKKGGHWEPIDPKNLPKEGTRVRYSRECKNYKNCSDKIALGSTGIVRREGPEHNWFGMSLDDYEEMYYNWFSFDGLTAKSLDMWVEDDE